MCDRCRVTFPPAQQQQHHHQHQHHHQPQPHYPQAAQVAGPPRSNKKLFIIVGVVALLGGLAVILALTLGGGGGSSGAGSPEAVAKGVIGALNDRDGGAYTRLFAPQDMGDKVIDCKFDDKDKEEAEKGKAEARKNWDKGRRIIEKAVSKTKAKFEFVAMEPKDPPQEKKEGDKLGERCTVKMTHALQSFEVAVKVDGDKTEKSIDMVRIGDTWYLAGPVLIDDDVMRAAGEEIEKQDAAGDRSAEGGAGEDEQMKLFRAYVDEACACKDSACLDQTSKRFSEKAKQFQDKKEPGPEAGPLMERLSRCSADIMQKEVGGQLGGGTAGTDGTGLGTGGGGIDLGGLGLGGGGSGGSAGSGDPIADFRTLADAMCACADKACAERVQKDLEVFSERYKSTQGTAEQLKQAEEISQRLRECMIRAMTQ
jgi:hypothetical protein